jgi:hypothetical protein
MQVMKKYCKYANLTIITTSDHSNFQATEYYKELSQKISHRPPAASAAAAPS